VVVKRAKPLTLTQKLDAALKACRRDRVRSKRKRCVKTALDRYGAKAGSGRLSTGDVNRGRRGK
jgi:hypothetical protein